VVSTISQEIAHSSFLNRKKAIFPCGLSPSFLVPVDVAAETGLKDVLEEPVQGWGITLGNQADRPIGFVADTSRDRVIACEIADGESEADTLDPSVEEYG
jgi:hypothetical protein